MQRTKKLIALVGFMGVGKSTWGRRASKEMNQPFHDLDKLISRGHNQSITAIFQAIGEVGFRKLETEYLKEAITAHEGILAVGGGTPCTPLNLELLQAHTTMVWLRASKSIGLGRLQEVKHKRPLLAGLSEDELERTYDALCAARKPYYAAAPYQYDIALGYTGFLELLNSIHRGD